MGAVNENFERFFLGHDDVIMQESLYQSLQTSGGRNVLEKEGESSQVHGDGQSQLESDAPLTMSEQETEKKEGESSQVHNYDGQSQLELDAVLAMSLQELETKEGESLQVHNDGQSQLELDAALAMSLQEMEKTEGESSQARNDGQLQLELDAALAMSLQELERREGESSQAHNDGQSQLELDAALAMSLQDLENQLDNASLNGTSGTEIGVNREGNTTNTSVEPLRQDNPQPARQDNAQPVTQDNAEQLQSQGEAIGTENKGLSEELIARLPTFKYKTGGFFFLKKKKPEECVICRMEFENREMLTTLPCSHQYHSKCVNEWLKLNKTCPVCNKEVFGS